MKHGKKTFVIIEAVLGILVILVLGFIIYKQNGHDPETIAVIIPDVDESEWSAFKYGLKMAAREYDTDVVIISKDNMETANDEIEIMNQEIIKGADAVIVKPIANRDGQQKLKQLEKSVPIMAVGDTFPEEPSGLHTIEPDHYHMGADLAQKLLENYRGNLIGKKIGIYSQHATSEAVIKRKKGICDTLKGSGAEILWSVSKEKDGVSEEAAERKAGGEKESDSDLGQSLKTAGEQKNDDLPEGRADLLKQLGCELVRPYENGYCVWKGEYSRRNQARIEAEYGALTVRKQERYADSQPAVHLLGYTAGTGDNGEEEGQCGLEKMYDQRLSKGAVRKYLSRDAAGNILRGSGILSDSEISGRFQISIDLKLQEKAEELLAENGRPGAVVVSSAETGEILASASYPVYNPNDVGGHLTSEKNELIDRVSAGTYPPGSVFKLVVAAAALEAGIADEDSVFECSGSIETGGITVRCSTGGEGGHGRITLRQALADSCNCAFIQLGMETGGQRIIEMAESMGLGADVCPQLSESTGHLPADAEECGIANLSIGQGTILATPLQITSVMNCVASGGIRLPLKILMPETEQDLIKYDVCPDILRESAEQKKRK